MPDLLLLAIKWAFFYKPCSLILQYFSVKSTIEIFPETIFINIIIIIKY